MGNSESSSGDAHDNIVNGSSEHKGYSAVADKRHQPLSSMDTSYRHEPPASASSSTIATSRRKHNKYIADNFNSLEEVSSFVLCTTSFTQCFSFSAPCLIDKT